MQRLDYSNQKRMAMRLAEIASFDDLIDFSISTTMIHIAVRHAVLKFGMPQVNYEHDNDRACP